MCFPKFWWLLTLATLGQGMFFPLILLGRRPGNDAQSLLPWASVICGLGVVAGLAYGVLQSDPVFVAGQLLLLLIVALNHIWNQ